MTDDARKRLQKRLAGRTSGVIGVGSHGALEDKEQVPSRLVQPVGAILYHPLDVYLITDDSNSMSYVIDSVARGMADISRELFETPDKGKVQMGVWGFNDHKNLREGRDWLLRNPLRANLDALLVDINGMPLIGNDDDAEAYECATLELAREIIKPKATDETPTKTAVVMFGDMIPHGLLAITPGVRHVSSEEDKRIYQLPTGALLSDRGCLYGVDYKTSWRALTTAADLTVFVGCTEHEYSIYIGKGIDKIQASIVDPRDPKQKYVSMTETGIIPALIMATARLAQSPQAAREYLNRLALQDPTTATRVAGYLTVSR